MCIKGQPWPTGYMVPYDPMLEGTALDQARADGERAFRLRQERRAPYGAFPAVLAGGLRPGRCRGPGPGAAGCAGGIGDWTGR